MHFTCSDIGVFCSLQIARKKHASFFAGKRHQYEKEPLSYYNAGLFSFWEAFWVVFSLIPEESVQWVAVWWFETEQGFFVVCLVFFAALAVVPLPR